jgi:hypothetical protein
MSVRAAMRGTCVPCLVPYLEVVLTGCTLHGSSASANKHPNSVLGIESGTASAVLGNPTPFPNPEKWGVAMLSLFC